MKTLSPFQVAVQDKKEVEAIFEAIKEKLEKDGFEIEDSFISNYIDFFSIKID